MGYRSAVRVGDLVHDVGRLPLKHSDVIFALVWEWVLRAFFLEETEQNVISSMVDLNINHFSSKATNAKLKCDPSFVVNIFYLLLVLVGEVQYQLPHQFISHAHAGIIKSERIYFLFDCRKIFYI